jgi:Tfp pilus assembly protein PilV
MNADTPSRRSVFVSMRILLAGRRGLRVRLGAALSRAARRLGAQDGFMLFEVLVAAVILAVGLVGLLGLIDTTVKATANTRAREGATNLAREIVEDARTIPYAQLSPTAVEKELKAMNGLGDSSEAAGWQVQRRGTTYTVTVHECSIDDPKDGLGKHLNAFNENPFCADSTATGTNDAQPEDLKRVTVNVTWPAIGRTPSVQQVLTLTAAGEAPGLSATNLRLSSPTVPNPAEPVVSEEPVGNTLTFTVSAPSGTKAMRWSLEGTTQSPDPVVQSGTTWTFSWPIPQAAVSDGTYTVEAQAIDATGVSGPPVSIPVTLIRAVPDAPSAIRGGYDTVYVAGSSRQVAELQWKANTERNVIGYRVYAPGERLVCPESLTALSLSLSCTDFEPPAPSAKNRTYSVVAVYRNAGGALTQGPAGTFTLASGPPPAPNPPTNLTLTKNEDGSVTLKWVAPTEGPAVSFYRIYRGSMNYPSRYETTGSGTATSFTDTEAVEPHSYWITAVNSNLSESTFLGPVVG